MPDLKDVEQQIVQTEKFSVRIQNRKGGKARPSLPDYPFETPAHQDTLVRDWIGQRFSPHYPKVEVEVLYGDGTPAPGKVSLMSVRLSGLFEPSE
jgi:hypothetical protein